MTHLKLIIILLCFNIIVKAQTRPVDPSPCASNGTASTNNITVSGTTTFTFATLADFTTPASSNSISVIVKSSTAYKLYVAGEIITAATPNTPIPLNIFTVSSTIPGTAGTITLASTYLVVATGASTTGRTHVFTLTRGAMNAFTQAPGTHTLYLHIRLCN